MNWDRFLLGVLSFFWYIYDVHVRMLVCSVKQECYTCYYRYLTPIITMFYLTLVIKATALNIITEESDLLLDYICENS